MKTDQQNFPPPPVSILKVKLKFVHFVGVTVRTATDYFVTETKKEVGFYTKVSSRW